MYKYITYGIVLESELPLKSLYPYEGSNPEDYITVKLANVPKELQMPAEFENDTLLINTKEFLYIIPEILKMYITNGKEIILEILTSNIEDALLYFYSNGLAAILLQRKLIPFHVSGVFLNDSEVLLFAAPSGTGKSTIAVKLQEFGLPIFTDDTAVITSLNGEVYAVASYPMARLWSKSIEQQDFFDSNKKLNVYGEEEYDKYGFHFHENFALGKFRVRGFVFLEESGRNIDIRPISKTQTIKLLAKNIYRRSFLQNMNLMEEQFSIIVQIANSVSSYSATRPIDEDSFFSFPAAINNQICQKYSNH